MVVECLIKLVSSSVELLRCITLRECLISNGLLPEFMIQLQLLVGVHLNHLLQAGTIYLRNKVDVAQRQSNSYQKTQSTWVDRDQASPSHSHAGEKLWSIYPAEPEPFTTSSVNQSSVARREVMGGPSRASLLLEDAELPGLGSPQPGMQTGLQPGLQARSGSLGSSKRQWSLRLRARGGSTPQVPGAVPSGSSPSPAFSDLSTVVDPAVMVPATSSSRGLGGGITASLKLQRSSRYASRIDQELLLDAHLTSCSSISSSRILGQRAGSSPLPPRPCAMSQHGSLAWDGGAAAGTKPGQEQQADVDLSVDSGVSRLVREGDSLGISKHRGRLLRDRPRPGRSRGGTAKRSWLPWTQPKEVAPAQAGPHPEGGDLRIAPQPSSPPAMHDAPLPPAHNSVLAGAAAKGSALLAGSSSRVFWMEQQQQQQPASSAAAAGSTSWAAPMTHTIRSTGAGNSIGQSAATPSHAGRAGSSSRQPLQPNALGTLPNLMLSNAARVAGAQQQAAVGAREGASRSQSGWEPQLAWARQWASGRVAAPSARSLPSVASLGDAASSALVTNDLRGLYGINSPVSTPPRCDSLIGRGSGTTVTLAAAASAALAATTRSEHSEVAVKGATSSAQQQQQQQRWRGLFSLRSFVRA